MSEPSAYIPPDDLSRELTVARPDTDQHLPHIGMVGDTYTVLVTGEDTDGKYTLVDMHVPAGGGPPPHRHDFEEMFTMLEGEFEVTFRGQTLIARAGETVKRAGQRTARLHQRRCHTGTAALHVCTSRAGRVLHAGGPIGQHPHRAARTVG